MSSQRGNTKRTRPQKYKNRTVFKNDLHDKTDQQKRLNLMNVSEVCLRCKEQIEWKIKYKKYKPLTQPKTCAKCQQRNIRKAYHIYCRDCARESRVCAKCGKSADEVEIEPPEPTPEEQLKLKVEMERLIKTFSERKRRAFLRYMEKGKQDHTLVENEKDGEAKEGEEADGEEAPAPEIKRVPYTREELLQKIEKLKLSERNEDGEDDDFSDSDDYDDSDEDGSDDGTK